MTTLHDVSSPARRTSIEVTRGGRDALDCLPARLTDHDKVVRGSVEKCLAPGNHEFATVDLPPSIEPLRTYTWHYDENFNKAHHWCLGYIAARNDHLVEAGDFLVSALVDLYHFDRASFAAATNASPAPLPREHVPKSISKLNSHNNYETYELVVKSFRWSQEVPHAVTTAVSTFTQTAPPDGFWIADYERKSQHWDPVVYASYGPYWQVEVARWD